MNDLERKEIREQVYEFTRLMDLAKENLFAAATIYVSLIDKYGNEAKEMFQKANPVFPKTAWTSIENVGRGLLHPKILFTRFSHEKRIRNLPVSEQKRICEDGVDYLTASNSSLIVRLEGMDDDQIKQIVKMQDGVSVIRSIPEQKSYIEALKNKNKIYSYTGNEMFRIEGNKVHVLEPVTMTRRQLLSIIHQMKGNEK